MAKTALYNMEGAAIGEIELSDAIFASDVNVAAMETPSNVIYSTHSDIS